MFKLLRGYKTVNKITKNNITNEGTCLLNIFSAKINFHGNLRLKVLNQGEYVDCIPIMCFSFSLVLYQKRLTAEVYAAAAELHTANPLNPAVVIRYMGETFSVLQYFLCFVKITIAHLRPE